VKLGIFGGTFDPVHIGHLSVAVEVRHALGLDRVLLVVANVPWQKVGERVVSAAEDRWAMVAAAVEGIDGVDGSRIELDRGGESYTVDTLEALAGDDLFLIAGSDVAASLDTWKRHDELPALATLVLVERPGSPPVPDPPGWKVERVRVPALDVSSSDLRARARDGRPLDVLVPPGALHVIRDRALYAGGSG
jgi:nicotinate-nucleotide adenylyltransferase